MDSIDSTFSNLGGIFCTPVSQLKAKLMHVKAFIFDWDGVFNNGSKNESGSSTFMEPDAMGTNLLRFNHWLNVNQLPLAAIISGENNALSFQFAKRERLHAVYFKVANKTEAFHHFCEVYHLKPEETAFVFDDVLDLSLAKICGVRILINRTGNPLFKKYVVDHELADYITGKESGNFALREACELMIGLSGNFDAVVEHRVNFSDRYQKYLRERQQVEVSYFSSVDGKIEAKNL